MARRAPHDRIGGHDGSRPRALRAEPHRSFARRRRAHRALQLALRAPPRRGLHSEDRGHRPLALDRGEPRRHPRRPALAGARLGRRPAHRGLPPDRALAALSRARAAPRGRGARLLLRVRARAARRRARGGAGAERDVPVLRSLPQARAHGRRAAPAHSRRGRHRRRRSHSRAGDLRPPPARRLDPRAQRRHADLQLLRRGGRRDHAHQSRHPRQRPPVEHAQAGPLLRWRTSR